MGVVFQAEDIRLQREVALKVVRPALAAQPGMAERFLHEARAAAAVKHDHIVTIYHVGEDRGIPFLAMELLEGESLATRLSREPRLSVPEIVSIGRQIAEGMAAAHRRGLIHRDIKPGNVWLEESRDENREPRAGTSEPLALGSGHSTLDSCRVKLLDFGLARSVATETSLTSSGMLLGTPAYMSPEQARGGAIDGRSDLFSLGCVLYQLCTGRAPFEGRDVMSQLSALANQTPPGVRTLNPAVPPALAEVVERLLAKDPADRFQSAVDVVQALNLDAGCVQPRRGRRWLVAAAVLLAAIALLPEIIIRIIGKDGQVTQINAPQAVTVEVEQNGTVVKVVPADAKVSEVQRFEGHHEKIWNVAFTPDGRRVLSAGFDSSVRVWDVPTRQQVQRIEGHDLCVYALAVSADGRRVLFGGGESAWAPAGPREWNVCLYDLELGQELHRFAGRGGVITSVSLSVDGRRALIGNFNGTVLLWDVENWKELERFDHTVGLWSLCFSPDDRMALTAGGGEGPLVRLWDLNSRTEIRRFVGHAEGVWQAKFSPDGRYVLTASQDLTARLWETESGREIRRFRHHDNDAFAAVAFSGDGRYLVTGGYNIDGRKPTKVRLWDVETGEELQAFAGHATGVHALAFAPDGRRAVSGGLDGTVRLWNLPEPEKEMAGAAKPRRQPPRVLMIVPSRDFNYAEVDPVRNQLGMYGVVWRIASTTLDACRAQEGGPPIQVPVKPDLLLTDAKAADYDAIYFCGGKGCEEYAAQGKQFAEARRLIDEALAANCTVSAMTTGVVILAEADVLRGRRAACYPWGEAPGVAAQRIEAQGAICSEQPVVEDGPFLTGRLTPDVQVFSRVLLKRLGIEPRGPRPPPPSD